MKRKGSNSTGRGGGGTRSNSRGNKNKLWEKEEPMEVPEEKEEEDDVEEEEEEEDYGDEEEEEEENGEEEEYDDEEEAQAGPRPQKRARAYAPPSHDELTDLKETEQLYKSNLFRLQMAELLAEVRVNREKTKVAEYLVHKLRKTLEALPRFEVTWSDAKELQSLKSIPIAAEEAQRIKFTFAPPKTFAVVGSYMLQTLARPNLNIDLAFELPQGLVRRKDVLNHRYSWKRAAYMELVGRHLKKESNFEEVEVEAFAGDPQKPVLVIRPKTTKQDGASWANLKTSFVIRLLPQLPATAFKPLARLSPDRSNIHVSATTTTNTGNVEDKDEDDEEEREDGEATLPTPLYNNRLLEDMRYQHHQQLLHRYLTTATSLADAIILFKVWLKQRGVLDVADSLNGFQASMLTVYLLQSNHLTNHMSAYQFFRAILLWLANDTTFSQKGIALHPSDGALSGPQHLALFSKAYEVVFLDDSGLLNITARMSKDALAELQREAKQSIDYFEEGERSFDAVFMSAVPFHLRYDQYVHIILPACSEKEEDKTHLLDKEWPIYLCHNIMSVLQRGLQQRLFSLRAPRAKPAAYPLADKPQQATLSYGKSITVGFALDPATASRILDMGPAADQTEAAAEFRRFWGPKSELRRFKDANINEVLVWECDGGARHTILRQMVEYLLERHFSIPSSSVLYIVDQLDSLINRHGSTRIVDTSASIITSFDRLAQQLREVAASSMPLAIADAHPISPAFRFTDVFPPQPTPLAMPKDDEVQTNRRNKKHRTHNKTKKQQQPASSPSSALFKGALCVQPLEVVLDLEGSSAWPNDLQAIRQLKAAFYIKLAQSVEENYGYKCTPTPEFVDVQYEGYVFRLYIQQAREKALLKKQKAESGLGRLFESCLRKSVHASSMLGFAKRYPSFGPTARLAKRWLHSHMFSGFFSDEAVELIVASLWLNPRPFSPPASPLIAFMRFLHLLAYFDWEHTPLVVDIDNEITATKRKDIEANFEQCMGGVTGEPKFPDMALFVATPSDKHSKWTQHAPSKQIFHRAVAYARRSLQHFSTIIGCADSKPKQWKVPFRTPLQPFDVLIHLRDESEIIREEQNLASLPPSSKYRKPAVPDQQGPGQLYAGLSLLDCYLKDLRLRFGDLAVFFHNQLQSDLVGVVWKPSAFVPQPLVAKNAHHSMPLPTSSSSAPEKEDAQTSTSAKTSKANKGSSSSSDNAVNYVIPNVFEILLEFKTVGKGLVQRIEVNHASPLPTTAGTRGSPLQAPTGKVTTQLKQRKSASHH
ncbi:Nucleolar protein 6 [Balamuthia mandrillaris]